MSILNDTKHAVAGFFAAGAMAVFTLFGAEEAEASTLAVATIDATFAYSPDRVGGSEFSLSGTYGFDASGAGDTSLVRPLVFGLSGQLDLTASGGPITPFSGALGPVNLSLDGLLAGIGSIFAGLPAGLQAGVLDVGGYMLGNQVGDITTNVDSYVTAGGALLPPGADLTFKYTNLGGAATPNGAFDLLVETTAPLPTLVGGLNDVLGLTGSLGAIPDVPIEGSFAATATISAVPLPATLPMLAVGGLLLAGLRRRSRA